jgi:CheY-like chemotaxis protein
MTWNSPSGGAFGTEPGTTWPSVLVVDDHHGFRAFARRLLEASGLRVMEAANGAEAVALARRNRPDLVLLDVQLPDLDGFEVAQLLSEQEPPPVVVLTSTREESDYGDRARASPVAGFLPKDELSAAALQSYLLEGRV